MNIAIIPARGGSKRIPKKNIKLFDQKPAIAYSIEAIKKTNLFKKIIVSTDDYKIAKIANNLGAETPFIRPKNISDDHSSSGLVVKHAIEFFKTKKLNYKNICCVYPVSPFISHLDIKKAYKILTSDKWSFVFTAAKSSFSIERSFSLNNNKSVKMNFPKNYHKRSQDLNHSFYDAAHFYWGKSNAWMNKDNLFDKYSTFIEIPYWRAIDIDTIEDWKNAEFINKYLHKLKK